MTLRTLDIGARINKSPYADQRREPVPGWRGIHHLDQPEILDPVRAMLRANAATSIQHFAADGDR